MLTDGEGLRGGKRPRDSTESAVILPVVKRRQGAPVVEEVGGKGVGGDRSEKQSEHATGLTINLAVIARFKPRLSCPIERKKSDLYLEQPDGRMKKIEIQSRVAQTGSDNQETRFGDCEVSTIFPVLPSNNWDRMQEREERFGSARSSKPFRLDNRYNHGAADHAALSCDVNDRTEALLCCKKTSCSEETSSLGDGGPSAANQPDTTKIYTKDTRAELRTRRVRFKTPIETMVEPTAPAIATSDTVKRELAVKMARRAERFGVTAARLPSVSLISTHRSLHASGTEDMGETYTRWIAITSGAAVLRNAVCL